MILCSLAAVTVAIERTLSLWNIADSSRRLAEQVRRAVYRGALAAMALGLLALAPVERLWVFGLMSILTGMPMATVLAAQSVLIAGIAPRAVLIPVVPAGAGHNVVVAGRNCIAEAVGDLPARCF